MNKGCSKQRHEIQNESNWANIQWDRPYHSSFRNVKSLAYTKELFHWHFLCTAGGVVKVLCKFNCCLHQNKEAWKQEVIYPLTVRNICIQDRGIYDERLCNWYASPNITGIHVREKIKVYTMFAVKPHGKKWLPRSKHNLGLGKGNVQWCEVPLQQFPHLLKKLQMMASGTLGARQ